MSLSHRHIEVFRAVMNGGSVTAAATLLHTSQPTVSRELARMEQLIGYELFDRVRGRLQPTARGLALFDEVQRAYAGLERVMATAQRLRRFEEGLLSIVCLPAFAHSPLPAACRRFLAAHPGVRVTVTPQESPLLEEWLTAQRHDLGLTEHDSAPPGTTLTPLLVADEVCVLPAAHPLAAHEVLAPRDFEGQPFISLSPDDPYRAMLDAVFAEHGVARRLVVDTDSAISVCAMAAQGVGLAVVNPLTALACAGPELVVRRFAVSVPFRVSVVEPSHRPSTPLTAHFIDALRAEAAEIENRLRALSARMES
jgi:DNA-binding transcriptional LysR family regulator